MDGLRARFLTPARGGSSEELLGERVRSLRRSRGLSLQDLSVASKMSRGFLSQVERNQAAPSVSSLARIADALGAPLDSLFSIGEPTAASGVVRADDRVRIVYAGGYSDEVLSPSVGGDLLVLMSTIQPGVTSGDESYSHNSGRELILVLEGGLEVEVEGETRVLRVGDALTLSSRRPHAWRNVGTTDAKILWVIAPRHR